MAKRTEVVLKMALPRGVSNVRLINYPSVEDTLVSEARLWLSQMYTDTVDDTRRVSYQIRDYLVRSGVER